MLTHVWRQQLCNMDQEKKRHYFPLKKKKEEEVYDK